MLGTIAMWLILPWVLQKVFGKVSDWIHTKSHGAVKPVTTRQPRPDTVPLRWYDALVAIGFLVLAGSNLHTAYHFDPYPFANGLGTYLSGPLSPKTPGFTIRNAYREYMTDHFSEWFEGMPPTTPLMPYGALDGDRQPTAGDYERLYATVKGKESRAVYFRFGEAVAMGCTWCAPVYESNPLAPATGDHADYLGYAAGPIIAAYAHFLILMGLLTLTRRKHHLRIHILVVMLACLACEIGMYLMPAAELAPLSMELADGVNHWVRYSVPARHAVMALLAFAAFLAPMRPPSTAAHLTRMTVSHAFALRNLQFARLVQHVVRASPALRARAPSLAADQAALKETAPTLGPPRGVPVRLLNPDEVYAVLKDRDAKRRAYYAAKAAKKETDRSPEALVAELKDRIAALSSQVAQVADAAATHTPDAVADSDSDSDADAAAGTTTVKPGRQPMPLSVDTGKTAASTTLETTATSTSSLLGFLRRRKPVAATADT